MPIASHQRRAAVEPSGSRAVASRTRASELGDRHAPRRELRQAADRLAAVPRERRQPRGSERARQQRVVPHLGVRVERQVVGEQRHLAPRTAPAGAARAPRRSAGARAPEEAVVREHQLRALRRARARTAPRCALTPRRDRLDQLAARHLQAIRAVVREALRPQQAVQLPHDVGQPRGHCARTIALPRRPRAHRCAAGARRMPRAAGRGPVGGVSPGGARRRGALRRTATKP